MERTATIKVRVEGAAEARAQLDNLQAPLYQRFMWKGRYFLAYAFTLCMLLVPLLLDKMDGTAYGTACTWLFGALVGGSAASRAAKARGSRVTGSPALDPGAGPGGGD